MSYPYQGPQGYSQQSQPRNPNQPQSMYRAPAVLGSMNTDASNQAGNPQNVSSSMQRPSPFMSSASDPQQSANPLEGIEELPTMRKLRKDETNWNCMKCGRVNPTTTSKCGCGFVNFAYVSDPEPIPVVQELPVPQEAVGTDIYWKCHCGYEYNMKEMMKCSMCQAPNPAQPAQLPPIPTVATVVQLDAQSPLSDTVWTCPQCKYEYNPKTENKCFKCSTPNPQFVQVPQSPSIHNSLAAQPSNRSSFSPDSRMQQVWKCQHCSYEYNLLNTAQCLQCHTPKFAPQFPSDGVYHPTQPVGYPQSQELNPANMGPYSNQFPQPPNMKQTTETRANQQYPGVSPGYIQASVPGPVKWVVQIQVSIERTQTGWMCSNCSMISPFETNLCDNCHKMNKVGEAMRD